MTYKELYLKEHPDVDSDKLQEVIDGLCPGDFWEGKPEADECCELSCFDCWNQEIPEESDKVKAKFEVLEGNIVDMLCDIGHPYPVFPKEIADAMIAEKSNAMKKSDIQKTVEKLQECSFKEAGDSISKATNAMVELTSTVKNIDVNPEVEFTGVTVESTKTGMAIKDSGTRREFATGAVRDIQEGKGRCDLMPLDVIAGFTNNHVLRHIYEFQCNGDTLRLEQTLRSFVECYTDWTEKGDNFARVGLATMSLEAAKHFEAGAAKYGEWNWQKGIPTHCYIDSAVRHYLKFLRGDKDEPHDRAFVWNILCCIWTCKHKPELNDYPRKEKTDE